jgi:UDP-N-acetylglucosamine 2-epimerase (non-hydrolysing)
VKLVSVVGARPQFVKAAPTSRAVRERHDERLVHTGQHYDDALSAVFFEDLGLPAPDHHLGVGSGSHATQTAAVLRGVDRVLDRESPDAVLVYGDTNSTLGAALAAAKRAPALVHVEAGLRSDDPGMPEEVNRRLTDHCSDLLCAPSARAVDRLDTEGVHGRVVETGDVMYDALLAVRERLPDATDVLADCRPLDLSVDGADDSTAVDPGEGDPPEVGPALRTRGVVAGEYVLATVHRARNTDDADRLAAAIEGLSAAPWPVVLPLHPRTAGALRRFGLAGRLGDGLWPVAPLGYREFLALVAGARRVATDSGGVQKEAVYLGTPCVTLRRRTEWPETVESGWNRLVGVDPVRVRAALRRSDWPEDRPSLYGDGDAAGRLVEALDRVE